MQLEQLIPKDANENNPAHLQFTDPEYRDRRNYIAKKAREHKVSQPIPVIEYNEKENQTWQAIYEKLKPLHAQCMSRRFLENLSKIEKALDMKKKVPQLKELDEYLRAETVSVGN